MTHLERAQRNIYLIYTLRALFSSIALVIPTIVTFWQSCGLSIFQVFVLEAFFAIMVVVGEVPSGYLADLLGRKRAIIAGGICLFIAESLYCVSQNFGHFLIIEALMGIGLSLLSGADEALMYDSLAEHGQEVTFSRHWGRAATLEMGIGATFLMIGGLLAAHVGLRTPFYVSVTLMGVFVVLAMFLYEPQREKATHERGHLREILSLGRELLVEKQNTRFILMISAIIFGFSQACFWALQPYLKETGVALSYNGFILAAMGLTGGIFASFATKIEKQVSLETLAFVLLGATALSFVGLGLLAVPWALSFTLVHQLNRACHKIIFAHALHKEVDSSLRATSLSVRSMFDKLIYAVTLLLFGGLIDGIGLFDALQLLGCSVVVTALLLLVFFRRGSLRVQQKVAVSSASS